MIRLDSVRSKHAHFSLRVLSHEIMVIRVVDFMQLKLSPNLMRLLVPLHFLLSLNLIDIVGVHLVLPPLFIVVILRLLKNIIEIQSLLIKEILLFLL